RGGLGLGVGGDDAACQGDFLSGRRKGLVRRSDGLGMDQRLAVEAQLAPLATDLGETLVVAEIEMDAVEDGEAIGARREQAQTERGKIGRRRVGKECRSRWSPYH